MATLKHNFDPEDLAIYDAVSSDADSSDSDSDLARDICAASEEERSLNLNGLSMSIRAEFDVVTKMSPLDIRFSQPKIKHLFGDGRRVADGVDVITLERCSEAEVAEYNAFWKLSVPFPTIEIVRWHCKLRDESTGKAKIDAETGEELYDQQERWFTLDNRRLYCLQQAAVRVLPEICVADVAEIRLGLHSRTRGLRKFRTLDLGRSIRIGSRADSVPFVRWCWEEKLSTVYDYLKTLQEGTRDQAVVESSKKLSGILRRRESSSAAINLLFDENGWVKVSDLLHELGGFLDCRDAKQFFSVVKASNKEKFRYELWPDSTESLPLALKKIDEIYIRACSRVAKERSKRSRATANGDSGTSLGASKGRGKTAKKATKLASVSETSRMQGNSKSVTVSPSDDGTAQREELYKPSAVKHSPEEMLFSSAQLSHASQTPEERLFTSLSVSSSSQSGAAAKLEKEEESRQATAAILNAVKGKQVPAEKPQGSGQKKLKPQKTAGVPASPVKKPGPGKVPGPGSSKYPSAPAQQAHLKNAYQMQAMFNMHTMMCAHQQLMMIHQSIQTQSQQIKAMEQMQAMANFQADMQNPWEKEFAAMGIKEQEEELETSSGGSQFLAQASTGQSGSDSAVTESQAEEAIEAQIAKALEAARERNPDNQLQAQIKKVMQDAQQRNGTPGTASNQNGQSEKEKLLKKPADCLEDEIARVMESARERTGNRITESI